jgi:hypothetical protein
MNTPPFNLAQPAARTRARVCSEYHPDRVARLYGELMWGLLTSGGPTGGPNGAATQVNGSYFWLSR